MLAPSKDEYEQTPEPAHALIAAGRQHSAGVLADGSVLAAGRPNSEERRVEGWADVVAVAVGGAHTASNTVAPIRSGCARTARYSRQVGTTRGSVMSAIGLRS
ncbi:RCC1-like domain-containing protein [Mycetocola zhadangensis]|uniref:RCC1-like domain-containing protein n=1 Tax=Mycetocola zhadangensis TaxID=1164595 RepID=UPI000EF58BA8